MTGAMSQRESNINHREQGKQLKRSKKQETNCFTNYNLFKVWYEEDWLNSTSFLYKYTAYQPHISASWISANVDKI